MSINTETATGMAAGFLSHTQGPKPTPLTGRAARRAFDRAYGEFKPRRSRVQRKRHGRK